MKFNSRICTSREQSERLLSLGLKKETADMVLVPSSKHDGSDVIRVRRSYLMEEDASPAWSLHRLMIIADCTGVGFTNLDNCYEALISTIAAGIRFGYFNEEYLNKEE